MQPFSPTVKKQKKKILARIKPLKFENWLVLVLDPKWESLVDGELVFEAYVENGHLQIRSAQEVTL
jgi:hypothetical protein